MRGDMYHSFMNMINLSTPAETSHVHGSNHVKGQPSSATTETRVLGHAYALTQDLAENTKLQVDGAIGSYQNIPHSH